MGHWLAKEETKRATNIGRNVTGTKMINEIRVISIRPFIKKIIHKVFLLYILCVSF